MPSFQPPTIAQLKARNRVRAEQATNAVDQFLASPESPDWATLDMILAQHVIRLTDKGLSIIEFIASVMNGSVEKATIKDRIRAAEILLDRGFGKPMTEVRFRGEIKHNHKMDSWTDEELRALIDIRRTITGIVNPTKIIDMPPGPVLDYDLSLDLNPLLDTEMQPDTDVQLVWDTDVHPEQPV